MESCTPLRGIIICLNNTGFLNTANGVYALYNNITGGDNTATGVQALYYNNGSYNTADGVNALYGNTTGDNNTAIGASALYLNAGDDNTAIGQSALTTNSTGFGNAAIGVGALYDNSAGSYNTVSGYDALSGPFAGNYPTAGNYNTAIGVFALQFNSTGCSNVALGVSALNNNTTSSNLVAVGDSALYNNTGYQNTALGSKALYSNTTGYGNTAVGYQAMYSNTATPNSSYGSSNTASGYRALYSNTSGYANTIVGYTADVNSGAYTFSSAFGAEAIITASNQVRIGNSSVTSIGGYASWSNISDGRVKKNIKQNVPGLTFINMLQPITYNLDLDASDKIIQPPVTKDKDGKVMQPDSSQLASRKAKQQIVYTGFIAQYVEKAAKSLNYDFSGVDAAKSSKDLYGLRYAEFVVPLVKAVQKLSVKNDAKDSVIASLQSQVSEMASLKNQVAQLTQLLQALASKSGITLPSQNVTLSSASLEQNVPNPYNQSTAIHYNLPATFGSAQIMITDISGTLLKQIPVMTKGAGIVNINAGTLSAGTYNYSLIVDGTLVDTKKMLLVK